MKAKIGTKIMLSYILILIVSFVSLTLFTNFVLEKTMRTEIRDELKEQSIIINKTINRVIKVNGNNEKDRLTNLKTALLKINLGDSEMFLLSSNRVIVSNVKETYEISSLKNRTDYVIFAVPFEKKQSGEKFNLILRSSTDQIQVIKNKVKFAMIIATIVSLIISIIVSYILQRNITKPIKQLKENMAKINIDEPDMKLIEIKTGDEIEDLYNGYTNMITRINQNTTERKRFFQNASHELKTPLMSIQGYAEAIKDGVVKDDELHESIDIIVAQSQKLKRTVEEIIYLSKLENFDISMNLVPTHITEYLELAVYNLEFLVLDSGIEIMLDNKISDDIEVLMDTYKFDSVLNNLISNSIRYAKSIIKIEAITKNNQIVIKVIDDGPGFSDEELSRIFERFYKGEKGNSGLGLSIVESIVLGHNGKIRADNHISGGAIFEITLPKKE